MKERIKAIILAKQKYREYDELVWLYTDMYGIVSAVIHGIKRKRAKFAGELILFSVVYVEIKRRKGLSTIYAFDLIVDNLTQEKLFLGYTHGASLSELTRRVLSEQPPIRGMFALLSRLFSLLSELEQPALLLVYLKQQLLPYTGSHIILDHCVCCGQTSKIVGYSYRLQGLVCTQCVHALHKTDIRETEKIKVLVAFFRLPIDKLPTLAVEKTASDFLVKFWDDVYMHNLGLSLKSQKVLKSMAVAGEEH